MSNPLMEIKDRRKPWQKKLQNFKIARCGAMLAENARGWGASALAADRELNQRGGRYGEKASDREVQYWLHMTGQHSPHHSTVCGRTVSIDREAVLAWLVEKGAAQ